MEELTDDDVWFCKRMAGDYGNSGCLVKTKSGLVGRTKSSDDLINGKVCVYTEKYNFLVRPERLEVIGFIN